MFGRRVLTLRFRILLNCDIEYVLRISEVIRIRVIKTILSINMIEWCLSCVELFGY